MNNRNGSLDVQAAMAAVYALILEQLAAQARNAKAGV